MIFNITDSQRKDDCKKFIDSLDEGDKWEVVIQERVKQRTKAQNRLYWSWVKPIADYCGYTKKQMHYELRLKFLGEESWTTNKGEVRSEPISTTDLTVEEFAEFLNKIDLLARKFNIVLPYPDDYLFCLMRE